MPFTGVIPVWQFILLHVNVCALSFISLSIPLATIEAFAFIGYEKSGKVRIEEEFD